MKKITLILLLLSFHLSAFNQNPVIRKRSDFPAENPSPRYGLITTFGVDIVSLDYSKYIPLIGESNDSLSSIDVTNSFQIGFLKKSQYLALGWGFNDISYTYDTLDVNINLSRYSLTYGYTLINTWRFKIRYDVGLKWNRVRITNTTSEDEISLKQYINDRDLDLRVNQPLSYMGLDIAYKFYARSLDHYYSFGFYGGYVFKLSPMPKVYSRYTRLQDVPPLGMNEFSWGFYAAINFDVY